MSREDFLRRVRDGLKALPDDDRTVTLNGHRRHTTEESPRDRTAIIEQFVERLEHHGARVRRLAEPQIPAAVYGALYEHRAKSVVAPEGLPEEWLETWSANPDHQVLDEYPQLSPEELDDADAIVTACAGAVADAGAVVLDGGPGQGRREVIPSCHVCVVRAAQIDSSLPEVLDKLDSRRPITWCGGPTAPSDAPASPGQGRHRQRQLVVLIVESDEISA
ncbi:L-lactate dehydrogenase complex protein LldG [Nocardia sp. GAS34]|uniref:LUD domain-containing protein n=1 Tax=unclassified Nocardia TaxID=2637762 RepID=UPI003D1F1EFC